MKSILSFTLAATVLAAVTASAAPPASVANRSWILDLDGVTLDVFIDTQGGPGAPGQANCRQIVGKIGGIAPFTGWYCPLTGRIHFVHRNLSSNLPMRTFTGVVSDQVDGQPLFMAGTATVNYAAFGDLGEYVFSAREQ
jgi:hypothetical protein